MPRTVSRKKKAEEKSQSVFDESPTFTELKREGNTYMLSWFDFIYSSIRKEIKHKPREFLLLFVIGFLGSVLATSLFLNIITGGISVGFSAPTFSFPNLSLPSFQAATVSSRVDAESKYDPVMLLERIKRGDDKYVLLDVRPYKDYELGHIKTAVSLPVYGTKIIKENGELDKGLLKREASEKIKGKDVIIVYGDSEFSSIPGEVAAILGRKATVLYVGWNEWAHFKTLWVPESMWDEVDISEYIQRKEN